MQAETPQPPAPESEVKTAPRDLRAELQTKLASEFTAKLNAAGTLPEAVCESLVTLLTASEPTSADVIAALALEDPIKPGVSNE
jgi:hypothetical protein